LAYPLEQDGAISRWMLDHKVMLGETADGGASRRKAIEQQGKILQSEQLASSQTFQSRSREEVLASVDQPIQRNL
jgi:hypothetical protein